MNFEANIPNPGIWLFHCHIEWHVDSGLIATMIEAPLDLQQTLTIPDDHYAVCAAAATPVPTVGNAAGNTVNLLDLSGEPSPPAPLPDGFTARGIVALVFSCVAGILGVAVVAWYGFADGSQGLGAGASDGKIFESPSGGVLQGGNGLGGGTTGGVQEVTTTSGGGAGART